MDTCLHGDIIKTLGKHYDRPLMSNVRRGDYVAGMVVHALGVEWRLCSLDWTGKPWDLERNDGARVIVKQAAALQPWDSEAESPQARTPVFAIAPLRVQSAKGSKGGEPEGYPPGRPADVYVFAWHPETDLDRADQRCPEQWQFFVVPERRLTEQYPTQQTIRLRSLSKITAAVSYDGLAAAVNTALSETPYLKASVMTPEEEALCYATDEVLELARQGKMRVYSSAEVRAKLGLDN